MQSILSNLTDRIYSWMWSESNPISSYHIYSRLLADLEDGATILDVGSGSGLYFTNPQVINLIKSKNLRINCIDIDHGALEICRSRTKDLWDSIDIECIDLMQVNRSYDYVFFIMSYPVIPQSVFGQYIRHAAKLCVKQIILFHNLVEEKNHFMDFIKPRIKFFTGVDFGRLTSIDEMKHQLVSWGFERYRITCTAMAKYGEISPLLKYIPVINYLKCKQYSIIIDNTYRLI